MAHSPIVVKDTTHVVQNPRQELFNEGIDKIKGGRGIILKGYKTEKMRIEEHLRNINFYYPIEEKNINNSPGKSDDLNTSGSKVTIKQPEMRFKPRTDLERIFDEINKNSFRKLDKNIIERQLKTLEMNVTKKYGDDNDEDEVPDYKDAEKFDKPLDDFDYLAMDKETEESKAEIERKIKLQKSRKQELNSQAKNLMKEFHNKTHFKGVTSMINFKNPTSSPRDCSYTKTFRGIKKNLRIFENPSDDENDYIFHEYNTNSNAQLKRTNFRLNYNPYNLNKKHDEENYENRKQLKYLKKLALEVPVVKAQDKNAENLKNFGLYSRDKIILDTDEKKLLPHEEKVLIDNQPFNVSHINAIAFKVLNKCNISKTKNRNNNKMLKAREGKLMMTNGISISEFQKKYKLN